MEDDEKVRRVAREMLTASGYEVLEASSGEEALSVYERHRGEIQLLLSDVVLPGMRGTELAKHLNASDRQVKAVFMSGYLDAPHCRRLSRRFRIRSETPSGRYSA